MVNMAGIPPLFVRFISAQSLMNAEKSAFISPFKMRVNTRMIIHEIGFSFHIQFEQACEDNFTQRQMS